MAEQGQSTCHVALGQVHANQAEEGVGLREGKHIGRLLIGCVCEKYYLALAELFLIYLNFAYI